MKKQKLILLFALFALSFFACRRKPIYWNTSPFPEITSGSVIIGNEGQYGNATATISQLQPDGTIYNNVYDSVNKQGLGDVLQSIARVQNNFYFVINNSNKIVVTDKYFKKVTEISIPQPRYITVVNDTLAYVSTIYSNKIYLINPSKNTIISELIMDKDWTEEMLYLNGNLYACNADTGINYVSMIDVSTQQISKRINIGGYAPSRIALDADGNIWVLSGNNFYGKDAAVSMINPTSNNMIKSFSLPSNYSPDRLITDNSKNIYLLLNDYTNSTSKIFKFANSANSLPANAYKTAPSGSFYYNIGFNPVTKSLFVSDAKDFSQQGEITEFKSNGSEKKWTVGITPGSFYFVP